MPTYKAMYFGSLYFISSKSRRNRKLVLWEHAIFSTFFLFLDFLDNQEFVPRIGTSWKKLLGTSSSKFLEEFLLRICYSFDKAQFLFLMVLRNFFQVIYHPTREETENSFSDSTHSSWQPSKTIYGFVKAQSRETTESTR